MNVQQMLSTQARTLLLQTGRGSLHLWVRLGHITEPRLRSDAEAIYDRMADRAPWPAQSANRVHLVFLVLPMAALYTALRRRGKAEQDAVEAVEAAAKAMAEPLRRVFGLLMGTGRGRRLFMRTVEWRNGLVLGSFFPAPAWQTTWVERSEKRVAFDCTRCYILDMLRHLDAAPVAVAACAIDSYACPQLRWSHPGSLATGAHRCRFEIVRADASQQTRQPRHRQRRALPGSH